MMGFIIGAVVFVKIIPIYPIYGGKPLSYFFTRSSYVSLIIEYSVRYGKWNNAHNPLTSRKHGGPFY